LPPDVTDTQNSILGVCLSVRPSVRFKHHLRDGRTDGNDATGDTAPRYATLFRNIFTSHAQKRLVTLVAKIVDTL